MSQKPHLKTNFLVTFLYWFYYILNIHIKYIIWSVIVKQNSLSVMYLLSFNTQSVVIDDVSVARLQKLLLIAALVSNFPLIIVGLGAIMLAVLIVLLIRDRKKKVWHHFLHPFFFPNSSPFACVVLIFV